MNYPLINQIRCEWPALQKCPCRDRTRFCYVSHKYQYLYFAAPKCASTTLRAYLPDKVGTNISSKFQDYFSFAVVRNPWDIAVTMYVTSTKKIPSFGKDAFGLKNTNISFGEFLDAAREHRNCHMEQLVKYIPADVDFIVRFENFAADIEQVRKRIGYGVKNTNRENTCKHDAYQKYYTDDKLIQKVADMYPDDIKRFGYRYE